MVPGFINLASHVLIQGIRMGREGRKPGANSEWLPFLRRRLSELRQPEPSTELRLILTDYRNLLLDRLDYKKNTVFVPAPGVGRLTARSIPPA